MDGLTLNCEVLHAYAAALELGSSYIQFLQSVVVDRRGHGPGGRGPGRA